MKSSNIGFTQIVYLLDVTNKVVPSLHVLLIDQSSVDRRVLFG